MVTDDTRYAWDMYGRIKGFKNESFESLQSMPALLVDAFDVIEAEVSRIESARMKKRPTHGNPKGNARSRPKR